MIDQALPLDVEPVPASGALSVLSVQRTCVHDGPGVRTVVFFRGCKMRCQWCHNPEAQAFVPAGDAGMSVAEVVRAVLRDRAYYGATHGGVTLSGGEPLLQPRPALLALLAELRRERIHVAVETAGDAPWSALEACLPSIDLVLFDLKAVGDEALHVELTGRPSRRIEDNLRRLAAGGASLRVRMCVVPGLNDSPERIEAAARLLDSIGQPSIELLRYHDLYQAKARRLGLAQPRIDAGRSAEALEAATRAFAARGIAVARAPEARRAPPEFTPRVHALKQAIRSAGYHVCMESAILKTRFYRKHGFRQPTAVQRAELLRHLLREKTVRVYPDELLVGNYTAKRVGGHVWVEYFGTSMAVHLWRIDRQKPIGFRCSRADKLRFYADVLPFWARRGLLYRVSSGLFDLGKLAARTLEKRAGFNNNFAAIAHYIVHTQRMLELGTAGIAAEVERARAGGAGERRAFYDGVLVALRALEELADRYAALLREQAGGEPDAGRRAELERMAAVCARVPRHPARTFHEALQSILFLHIALCTESFENAISLGRLDQVLAPYYQADLAAGRIDYASARELLACFVLKIDEVILLNDGDSMFRLGRLFESLSTVETVTIGGVDADGKDATNAVSRMILDVCELRPIGVNMAARVHAGSPPDYLERIAEVYLDGSPMPALYNDEVYIDSLRRHYPTPLGDARDYAIVGCVEPVASRDHFGNTDCANVNVTLPLLQALFGDDRPLWTYSGLDLDEKLRRWLRLPRRRPPASMDELVARFEQRLDRLVAALLADHQRIEAVLARDLPTPLASSLFEGCIRSGKDVYAGGATFNTSGVQAVGIVDVADSLLAIDELVFKQGRRTMRELCDALAADFRGEPHQSVQRELLALPKFGDDRCPEAATWVDRVLAAYVAALGKVEHRSRNGKYVAGYYGLNVNLEYGRKTPALPSGRAAGTPLANSICPHYGMQLVDLTSSLNAVSRVSFARYAPNGTTLTSTIDAGLFPGPAGVRNLAGLIRGFFDQGGMQFQPNLVSRELLLDAYRHPGKHKDLVVRIAGYCAYFDDLSDELKREIIDRTYYSDARPS